MPKDENTGADLFQILSQQLTVKNIIWDDKFTDLFDNDRHGMKNLICIFPESIQEYNTLVRRLEKDPRVVQLFNTDLSHVEQYLFTKLKIEPTSKVEVQYDKNESRLIKISKIDEDLGAAPPPFSILYFEIHTTSSLKNVGHDVNDPVTEIRARYQHEPEISFEGNEDSILKEFSVYVQSNDPDILFSSNQYPRGTDIFDYFFVRMTKLGLNLQLGRDENTNKRSKIEGRVCLSNKSFHNDSDLVGLIERARFGVLPLKPVMALQHKSFDR